MSVVADWLLSSLGATGHRPGASGSAELTPRLVDAVPWDGFGAGLPNGTAEYCTGVALALGAVAGRPVSGVGVAVQLRLPEVMAASYGSALHMRPAEPVPVEGGWVHADLGSVGDRDLFDRLLATLPPGPSAPQVAAAAQEWRLAVCDYRNRTVVAPQPPVTSGPGPGATPRAGSSRLKVLDLTNMWAGPLATWLLQDLGAEITKVEPSFRPDGFRALDGRGIHPGGRRCDPGRDSGMWNALNSGKRVVDLDLRAAADRERFLELAAASDVVIDSFSPRVMPNFGLDLPAGPIYVSVPAFPPGARRQWIAYGTGIHAVSGLGDLGDGRIAAPAVSYPDPVAGFTAALGVMAAVTGRDRGTEVGRVECPLFSSVQPLLTRPPDPGLLLADAAGTGPELLRLGSATGVLEPRPVCGSALLHPASVFHPKQNVF